MAHKHLDGLLFTTLVSNGCENLKKNVDRINELNVFPVPDGDTGTNMKMTIEGGVNSIINDNNPNIYEVSKKLQRSMVMSARGNSGVILSQFFKGLSIGLENKDFVDVKGLLDAFKAGVAQSYKVVRVPTEGTILTVMREATSEVEKSIEKLDTIEDFFKIFIKAADVSLLNTPNLLDVLKEANVIDSGGAGFNCIIEGMALALDDKLIEKTNDIKNNNNNVKVVSKDIFNADSTLTYGYCTEFILQLQNSKVDVKNFDIKIISDYLESIGDSLVIFKDEDIVKVHVHTFTPGKVINYCQKFGEYITFKMENMSIQHNQKEEKAKKIEFKKYTIVAVSPSNELSNIFKDLGCDEIVSGGQTMNPSSNDFINAFDKLNTEYIFVFPNNSNIIMAAKQAGEIYDKAKVIVINSKSIAQCYSALTMIDFSSDNVDTISEIFNQTIDNVTTGSITYSIRDCVIDGIDIKKDEFISFIDNKLVSSSKNKIDAVKDLLNKIEDIEDKSLITLIYGKDVKDNEKEEIIDYINSNYSDLEVYGIDGNQDVYSFIIAIE